MKTISWLRWNSQVAHRQKRLRSRVFLGKATANWKQKITQSLRKWRDRLTDFSLNYEPQVWQKTDRCGDVYFHVYDPYSDRYFDFNSEAEVRWWLDKHYYL